MSGTVHAHNELPNGGAATGEIVFTVNTTGQVIRDPAGNVVFQGPLTVKLIAGEATVTLPASDDLTLEPSGFTFTATEQLRHVLVDDFRTVDFQVLDGQTHHLADFASTDEVAEDPSYGANLNSALGQIENIRDFTDEEFVDRFSVIVAEQMTGQTTVQTNLFTDPRGASGWSATVSLYGTPAIDTTEIVRVGSQSVRLARTGNVPSNVIGRINDGGQAVPDSEGAIPVTAGEVVPIAFQTMCEVNAQSRIQVRCEDSDGNLVGGSNVFGSVVPNTAMVWARPKLLLTVPAGATQIRAFPEVLTYRSVDAIEGTLTWFAEAIASDGDTVPDYFDGSYTDTTTDVYAWTGPTDASASTRGTTIPRAAVTDLVVNPDAAPFAVFAQSELASQPGLLQALHRRSKGQVVGTNGRGCMAFRVDHQLQPLIDNIHPVMKANQIPYSLGIVSRYPEGDPHSEGVTAAQIMTLNLEGAEIDCHSATHQLFRSEGYDGIVRETSGALAEIQAMLPKVKVQGWQQPGGFNGLSSDVPGTEDKLRGPSNFNDLYPRNLLSTFGKIEAYSDDQPGRWMLPGEGCIGFNHLTMQSMTLAELRAQLAVVVADPKAAFEFMIHPYEIGRPGNLSLADWTTFMGECAAARDAGQIELMTPSAMAYADPSRRDRMELIRRPDFDGLTTANIADDLFWKSIPSKVSSGDVTIVNDGTGYGGSSAYLRINNASKYVSQPYNYLLTNGVEGQAIMIEAKVRAASGSPTAYLSCLDLDDSAELNYARNPISFTGDGTVKTIRHLFIPPTTTGKVDIRCGRPGSSTVAIDVLRLRAYFV